MKIYIQLYINYSNKHSHSKNIKSSFNVYLIYVLKNSLYIC